MLSESLLIRRLREIRQVQGKSAQDIATATGIPRAAIAKMEVGRRRVTVNDAVALCEALGVDLRVVLSAEPMTVVRRVEVV